MVKNPVKHGGTFRGIFLIVCIYIYIFHSSSFILYFPVKSLEVRNFSCKLCFYSLHCMDLMFFFYFFIINE